MDGVASRAAQPGHALAQAAISSKDSSLTLEARSLRKAGTQKHPRNQSGSDYFVVTLRYGRFSASCYIN